MHVPLFLLSALALAPGDGGPSETQPSVVRLSCDFTHYPPKGNVGISLTQCDVAIFADEHPHLRLTTPEKSRFVMAFSLPGAPKTAFLEAVHLASADGQGKCESPVSVAVNGKPVVENWNVGVGTYQKTRWRIADKLRKGENTIEWQAGKLRTHYWLRKAQVEVTFQAPVEVRFSTPEVEHALFWEGRFDQCSYNALATVLDHFYGVEAWNKDRESYEKRVFVSALDKFGLGAY